MSAKQKRQSIKRTDRKKKLILVHHNNKSKHSSKSRTKRSKTWMGQQQLKPEFFNFVHDDTIDNLADKVNKFKSKDNSSHYLYVAYHKWYFPYVNTVGKWTDYKKMFKGSYKQIASNIWYHQALRVNVFYYLGCKNNKKFRNSKSGKFQTGVRPVEMAYIMHDKDKSKDSNLTYVAHHVHIALKFFKRISVKKLGKWLGITPQNLQTKASNSKSKKYEWDNMVAYLTHAKQPDKHLYNSADVLYSGFNYKDYVNKHKFAWKRYRFTKDYDSPEGAKKNKLIRKYSKIAVASGKISKSEVYTNDTLFHAEMGGAQSVDEAQAMYYRRKVYLRLKAKMNNKYFMPVIFIEGDSGVGKSYFAKKVINKLCKDNGNLSPVADVFKPSSGKNQLDQYTGQSIAYLDEERSTNFKAQDLIDMMGQDPSFIGARYQNRLFIPRVILITSIQPSAEFFSNLHNQAQSEQIAQFYRRLTFVVKVFHDRSVGLYRPAYIKDGVYNIKLHESFGLDKKRATNYYLYPRPKQVEKPTGQKGLQWTYADKSWPSSEDEAIDKVVGVIERCNDYKNHSKTIDKMIHGEWPKVCTLKNYTAKTKTELKTDVLIKELKREEALDEGRTVPVDTNSSEDSSSSSLSDDAPANGYEEYKKKYGSDFVDDSNPF